MRSTKQMSRKQAKRDASPPCDLSSCSCSLRMKSSSQKNQLNMFLSSLLCTPGAFRYTTCSAPHALYYCSNTTLNPSGLCFIWLSQSHYTCHTTEPLPRPPLAQGSPFPGMKDALKAVLLKQSCFLRLMHRELNLRQNSHVALKIFKIQSEKEL